MPLSVIATLAMAGSPTSRRPLVFKSTNTLPASVDGTSSPKFISVALSPLARSMPLMRLIVAGSLAGL